MSCLGRQSIVSSERPAAALAVAEGGASVVCRVEGDGILQCATDAASLKVETHGDF